MSQPGKLDTISPTLRKVAVVPAPVQTSENDFDYGSLSISTGHASSVQTDSGIRISVDKAAKTGVAFFSIQNLLAMSPGWSFSLVSHAVLFVLLTVIATTSQIDKSALRLDGLMVDAAAVPDVDDLMNEHELNETELLKVDVAALNSEASEDTAEIIRDDGLEVSLMEGFSDGIGMEAMAQTGLTPLPNLDEGGIVGAEDGTSPQFFGTEAMGNRFVFIIDASDSMNEDYRWHQAIRELEKSIGKLGEDQTALVLLYNFQTFPMFDTRPESLKMLPVTEKFKKALSRWLDLQRPTGGTRPAHALSYSLTLDPDAIFLLSDGLLADNSIQLLARENAARDPENGDFSKIPIHTVSLGPNEAGAELMKFIADNNDGKFTWVR